MLEGTTVWGGKGPALHQVIRACISTSLPSALVAIKAFDASLLQCLEQRCYLMYQFRSPYTRKGNVMLEPTSHSPS